MPAKKEEASELQKREFRRLYIDQHKTWWKNPRAVLLLAWLVGEIPKGDNTLVTTFREIERGSGMRVQAVVSCLKWLDLPDPVDNSLQYVSIKDQEGKKAITITDKGYRLIGSRYES